MRYVKACEFLTPKMSVLDAACGTGYGTAILAKKCEFIKGLDFNDDALKEARTNYPNLSFEKYDLTNPKYGFGYFDAAISIETIEHFKDTDIPIYLGNIRTKLIKRGLFIVTTPYCVKSGPSPVTKQHLYEFSLDELEMTLHNNGFTVKAIYPERHEGLAGRLGYCMVHCVAR